MGLLLVLLKIFLLIQRFIKDAGEFKSMLELSRIGWIVEHEVYCLADVITKRSLKTTEWE